ncbi:hypothetical protein B0A48_07196 [Cryoendolithus antarcticus]|uniref:Small ribosomal subunit protein mS29 n=1 Tax=Cryoendolithus antarcticus TaxID=1507870 RepID=A0A1V8T840_9PEZI|nr:hypothetical protein B0A48_07196 [Cryoendolithus antarcticus]
MSRSICSRCLSQQLPSPRLFPAPFAEAAAFSTSPSNSAAANKKVVTKPGARQGTTLRLSKNKREAGGRPPAPGERKASRKKISLSNPNALEVQGLQDLTKDYTTSARLAEVEGRVLGLQEQNVEALKALEAFKHTQGWRYFRKPATLVRRETVELARAMEEAEGSAEGTKRWVLCGEQGSGKSVLQLQAMVLAQQKGWVVVHLPDAQDIAIGHSSYAPSGDGRTYIQPHYTAALLSRIAVANQEVLSKLELSQSHDLPIPVQSNISLSRFAELGARDPEIAWPVYCALMAELTTPSATRPPLLFTMDAIDHIMRPSGYLDGDAKPLHSHDLAIVSHYLSFLSGSSPLPHGGMILAATTASNRPKSPTLSHILATQTKPQQWDPHHGYTTSQTPTWDPYAPFDQRVADSLAGVEVKDIKGLSKDEAKGVMEFYALSGMLRGEVTERLVGEKWTLSGGGVFGELERGSVGMRV